MNPKQRTSASTGNSPYARSRQRDTPDPARNASEPWYELGACKGTNPELFFPDTSSHSAEARAICNSECRVREECLKYALENDERFGIWGGLSARQRNKMRTGKRPRLAAVAEESPEQAIRVAELAYGAA